MRRLLPLFAVLLLTACGGAVTTAPTTVAPPDTVAAATDARADVFPASGTERATVVLYHGWTDLTPDDYRPWIRHLTESGVTVIFPRYQRSVLSLPAQMLADAESATRAGLAEAPPTGPVIAVGYSLGGGFAVVYAANAAAWGVTAPAAVYGIFPAMPPTTPEPFGVVPEATPVTLLVGDRDAVVGRDGATSLADAIAPHPVAIETLSSTPGLVFEHLAAKRTDAAARTAFWRPLDRIVDRLAPR